MTVKSRYIENALND